MSDLDAMQEWCANQMSADDHLHTTQRSTNFVEITRLPKKIDARSLTSMIVTATRLVPKSARICYKGDELEIVGIVEFQNATKAFLAVDKLRLSSFAKRWHLKLMESPEFSNPERSIASKLKQ